MKVGYYQFRPLFAQPDKNIKKIISTLTNSSADLIVLPELALSGYHFRDKDEVFEYSEDPARSQRLNLISQLAKKKDCYFVVGFAEKTNSCCYNSAALIGPGGIEHVYRKAHLFNEEKKYFAAGDTEFKVHNIKNARIGIMICFDWVFPEVARTMALQGVQILCQPANLVLAYCQQTMLVRSLENRIFSITANRYGIDNRPHGKLKFTGKSQIVAPDGKLLNRAPAQKEMLAVLEINPEAADNKFITEYNHLFEDRRSTFYKL